MTEKEKKYIEGIGWRYDLEHSMLRRRDGHDYTSRCIYMLTLTLEDRSLPLLGTLAGDPDSEENPPHTEASPLGELVAEECQQLHTEYPQLSILRCQLMPDHLHLVVFVRDTLPIHLSKIIGKLKNRCNKHYWAQLTAAGRLGPKGEEKPPRLFSQNFQDSILTHSGQLEAMICYVEENPRRALIKRKHRDLFTVVGSLEFGGHTYAAVGNRWLLERPMRLQVRCHNNTTAQNLQLIELQREYFLSRGQEGAVIVSPCISEGEKQIATAALEAKTPLIVLLENGFSPLFKPSGKYFYACAEGLLLMLAPWPYHMQKQKITRQQCLALNDMAASASTEPWTPALEAWLMRKGGEGAG